MEWRTKNGQGGDGNGTKNGKGGDGNGTKNGKGSGKGSGKGNGESENIDVRGTPKGGEPGK